MRVSPIASYFGAILFWCDLIGVVVAACVISHGTRHEEPHDETGEDKGSQDPHTDDIAASGVTHCT